MPAPAHNRARIVETYTPGHSGAVSDFMARRTLASHGAFFAPYLRPGLRLLDCGCGPGSITLGLAAHVDPGEVVGIDFAPDQIARARQAAAREGRRNVRFEAANVYSLPFENGRFERVFSHALFEHLADPQKALRELHRVLAPGGVIGLCSPDWGGFLASPPSPHLSRALDAYIALQTGNGGDVQAGRNQGLHLAAAGFEAIELSARYECYDSRELIAEYLARRLDEAGDTASASALRDWSTQKPGMFAQAWVSAVARKPREPSYDPATPIGGDDGNSKLGA
ncbi:MAG TPA: methyltransferase domain-containing protein [Burkholderiales bacterium]|nr:methyltransferase domain-containing protein [Burkholderiales bacterium]